MKHICTILLILLLYSCESGGENKKLTPEDGEEFSGGKTTVFRKDALAFSQRTPGLDINGNIEFESGDQIFNRLWVASPSTQDLHDGLGPLFNARACQTCHFRDGRGRPPKNIDDEMQSMLIRLSIGNDLYKGPIPDPNYGGQLQEQGNGGLQVKPEGKTRITYETINGTYPDGTPYELIKPTYTFIDLNYGAMSEHIMTSPRVAPQMIGLGLFDAIDESDILSYADENDSDNNGISGRPNYVWDVTQNKESIGRFGWKANQPNIEQQVAGAFNGDLGISTHLFKDQNDMPNQNLGDQPKGYDELDALPYEISPERLARVVFYSRHLAVPARRNHDNENVLRGKKLFNQLNCSSCHRPSFITGNMKDAPELSNQKIFPYTDLLLHDMGDELADGRPDFKADGNEWKTPPLWGIGLFEVVNEHTRYLHDGRARNIEEAILWHGGEAEKSKQDFMKLTKAEREHVLEFLNSL